MAHWVDDRESELVEEIRKLSKDADYWKQKYEGMKERCEAAERLLIDYDPLYPNGMKKDYEKWQSLKQKQL